MQEEERAALDTAARLKREAEEAADERARVQKDADNVAAEEAHLIREMEEAAAEDARIQKEAAERAADKRRLPDISERDMEATAGASDQHSRWFHENIGPFHSFGDRWTDEKLQHLFCEGIFQHYFCQFTGFDFEQVKNVVDGKYDISFKFSVINRIQKKGRKV